MPIILYSETLSEEDIDVSQVGDGLAVPAGVETKFDYNGLILNDRSVVDKYRIISIDGLDDADVRDSRVEKPSDDGEIPLKSLYGGRTIAIAGRIEAYEVNKLREMQTNLRTAFSDVSTEIPLQFLTGDVITEHFIDCKKLSKNQWGEEQRSSHHFFRDFVITLRASNPRFFRSAETVQVVSSSATPFTVVNYGNYHTEPQFIFRGALTGPVLQNTTTNQTIDFSAITISSGDSYTVDAQTKTVKDINGLNKFSDFGFSSEMIKLEKGNNDLLFTASSGAGTLEIRYRDSWI
jgi:hypothetical protein